MGANELRKAFAELPPLGDLATPWDRHRRSLRRHVENDNIDNFLKWSTIVATMFVGEAPYIRSEFDYLMAENGGWKKAIQESGVGNPSRLSYADWTSGNLVHQAYHLKQWQDHSDLWALELDEVFEIGPGYGAMAVVLRQAGFQGDFGFHDLPEFDLLRRFYLDRVGIEVTDIASDSDGIRLTIALFSVDEMPLADRGILKWNADEYLIAYHPDYGGVDNTKFFKEFTELRPDLSWYDYPWYDYRYLVGVSG